MKTLPIITSCSILLLLLFVGCQNPESGKEGLDENELNKDSLKVIEMLEHANGLQRDDKIRYCGKIIEIAPNNPVPYRLRAIEYSWDIKKLDSAVMDCKKVVELEPNKPINYFDLAKAQLKAKHFKDGLKSINRYFELDSTYWAGYLIKAMILSKMKRYNNSIEFLKKWPEEYMYHPEIRHILIAENFSELHEEDSVCYYLKSMPDIKDISALGVYWRKFYKLNQKYDCIPELMDYPKE
ncbi:MAG: hypothetical protein R2799_05615 [Crocinitomicaceae bacterium]